MLYWKKYPFALLQFDKKRRFLYEKNNKANKGKQKRVRKRERREYFSLVQRENNSNHHKTYEHMHFKRCCLQTQSVRIGRPDKGSLHFCVYVKYSCWSCSKMGETDRFYKYDNPPSTLISMQKGFLESLVGGKSSSTVRTSKKSYVICVLNLCWGPIWRYMCKETANITLLRIYSTWQKATRVYCGCTNAWLQLFPTNWWRLWFNKVYICIPLHSRCTPLVGSAAWTRAGNTEHCTVQHGLHVFAIVQCCFEINIPLDCSSLTKNDVSWMKRTTKQTKEDKREWGREKGWNISALFSMKTCAYISNHQKRCVSSDLPFFHPKSNLALSSKSWVIPIG